MPTAIESKQIDSAKRRLRQRTNPKSIELCLHYPIAPKEINTNITLGLCQDRSRSVPSAIEYQYRLIKNNIKITKFSRSSKHQRLCLYGSAVLVVIMLWTRLEIFDTSFAHQINTCVSRMIFNLLLPTKKNQGVVR